MRSLKLGSGLSGKKKKPFENLPQKRNPMMDQQKRRRRLLFKALILIGFVLLNLVFAFWAFLDGEKINLALVAVSISLMTIAASFLSQRRLVQKGPTPPDPK